MTSYDEDRSDERQYCVHGTFIGSWWGPDYLCGYCEMGVTTYDLARGAVAQSRQQIRKVNDALVPFISALFALRDLPSINAVYSNGLLGDMSKDLSELNVRHAELVRAAWNERANRHE